MVSSLYSRELLSSGETGGGMKGGRCWWNLVGSAEKAVNGLEVVKLWTDLVYTGTGVGGGEEYLGAEEKTVKGAAVVECWKGPRGIWLSDMLCFLMRCGRSSQGTTSCSSVSWSTGTSS